MRDNLPPYGGLLLERGACPGEGTDEAAAVPTDHQGSEAVGQDIIDLVADLLARSLDLGEGDDHQLKPIDDH